MFQVGAESVQKAGCAKEIFVPQKTSLNKNEEALIKNKDQMTAARCVLRNMVVCKLCVKISGAEIRHLGCDHVAI